MDKFFIKGNKNRANAFEIASLILVIPACLESVLMPQNMHNHHETPTKGKIPDKPE